MTGEDKDYTTKSEAMAAFNEMVQRQEDKYRRRTNFLRVLAAVIILLAFLVASVVAAGRAHSAPGPGPVLLCQSAIFVGQWCDSDGWADGSYMHCYSGWGKLDCSRVCPIEGNPVNPPLADYDPRTVCGAPDFGPARY